MKKIFSLAVAVLFFLVSTSAQPDYPEREITVYNGSTAGGITDLAARILVEIVAKEFRQPVVVVNKPGAAHTICANLVANAKPDGYTLGTLSSSAFTQVPHFRKVPFDVWKDFTWIGAYTEYTAGLVVKTDAPWKTINEFLDYAKNNPGKVIYGSDGHGLGTHVLMEYIALKRGGIDWKHVPISGGPRLATALIGGHIHAYSAAGGHISFIKDGTMRLLVSYNKTRMKAAPDVPTLSELGLIDVTGGTPMVIIGPKGLPDSIPKKLESAFLKAMKDPSYLAFLDKVEFSPVFGGSQETRQGIEKQYEEWGKMIKTTGIKLEERKQ